MVKIYNSGNVMETQMVLEMLKRNGIVGVKKDIGAGGYMTIATGMSVSGVDIYVSEQDAERAAGLIQEMTGETETEVTENEDGEQNRATGIYRRRRVFAIVMLIVALCGILSGVFLSSF